ncbi:hypothetical protein JIN78_05040 [Roseibacillus ishigakijimensis]|uniref:Sulfotransferase family protein n=2 Tax=Roseibacillus ishigakijimensis TaxID=454146 RepID=A0A934RRY5_9BACT|nr:hypothetical protein [Roseibacillus ishigakijimensis]
MSVEDAKSLFWFVHMHKAGGTTIVKCAEKNHEILTDSGNGNILEEDGTEIDYRALDGDGLRSLVSRLLNGGVTFVASEFSVPNLEVLLAHPQVKVFTFLREPGARFLSNFRYDYQHQFFRGDCDWTTFFRHKEQSFYYENYYTRILSRVLTGNLRQKDCERAYEMIKSFDFVGVLEDERSWSCFFEWAGWEPVRLNANSSSDRRAFFRYLKRPKKWGAAYRMARFSPPPPEDFNKVWNLLNESDMRIYRWAQEELRSAESRQAPIEG